MPRLGKKKSLYVQFGMRRHFPLRRNGTRRFQIHGNIFQLVRKKAMWK